ncbi:MAG: hypothetical protein ACYS8Y_09945, partial [Planctomycetota bacterium]
CSLPRPRSHRDMGQDRKAVQKREGPAGSVRREKNRATTGTRSYSAEVVGVHGTVRKTALMTAINWEECYV